MGYIPQAELIDVGPFKEAIEKRLNSGELTKTVICRRLGWEGTKNYADTSKLDRAFGLAVTSSGKYVQQISITKAEELCKALYIDPVDLEI